MILTPERTEEINTPGSMYKLNERIAAEKINITAQEIIKTLPSYLPQFTENQQLVFKAYYWRQMSIHEIRITFGFKSINDVERPLKSATEKYIRLLKADYSTK